MNWLAAADGLLHFSRGNGWECAVNLSTDDRALPAGEILLSSSTVVGSRLPPETAVWLRTSSEGHR